MERQVLLVSELNGISLVLIHVLLLNVIKVNVSMVYVNVLLGTKENYVKSTLTIALEIHVAMETA